MDKRLGLVIKSIDYIDNSKICTLLTPDGIVTLTFKGAQKPTTHTFNYSKELTLLEFESKGKFLTSGDVISHFPNITKNLDLIENSLIVLELLYTFREHITDYKVCFEFARGILEAINGNINASFLQTTFRAKFLYLLGVGPSLFKCINCGESKDIVYFSLNDGGVKCRSCSNGSDIPVPLKDIALLQYMVKTKLVDILSSDLSDYNLDITNKILDALYDNFLDYRSNTKRVFNKLK